MKRYLPLFIGVAFSFYGSAQTVYTYNLDHNNAGAVITDGGVFSTRRPRVRLVMKFLKVHKRIQFIQWPFGMEEWMRMGN